MSEKKMNFDSIEAAIEDLKNGIEWILNNDNYQALSKNAREKVIKHFSEEVLTPKFIELYKKYNE